jgi:hypothetical protein
MNGRLRRRIRYWRQSAARERLLREEMDAHLEMMIREMMEGGMTEPEARQEARRQFGNLTQQQEEARGAWIARWLTDLLQDTAYAARTIRQRPGFATLAILSTALGIGACSLIFGLANFALLRPLPVEDANQLMSLSGKNVRRGRSGQSMAHPDFADLRQARSFQGMSAFFSFLPGTISSDGELLRYCTPTIHPRTRFRCVEGRQTGRDAGSGAEPSSVDIAVRKRSKHRGKAYRD